MLLIQAIDMLLENKHDMVTNKQQIQLQLKKTTINKTKH